MNTLENPPKMNRQKQKPKPKQSVAFDLNDIPEEPSNGLAVILNILSVVSGLLFIGSAVMQAVGMKADYISLGALLQTAIMAALAAQVLRHVHYMRELAEWTATRELEKEKSTRNEL